MDCSRDFVILLGHFNPLWFCTSHRYGATWGSHRGVATMGIFRRALKLKSSWEHVPLNPITISKMWHIVFLLKTNSLRLGERLYILISPSLIIFMNIWNKGSRLKILKYFPEFLCASLFHALIFASKIYFYFTSSQISSLFSFLVQ